MPQAITPHSLTHGMGKWGQYRRRFWLLGFSATPFYIGLLESTSPMDFVVVLHHVFLLVLSPKSLDVVAYFDVIWTTKFVIHLTLRACDKRLR